MIWKSSVEVAARNTEETAKNSGENTEDDNKVKLPLQVIFECKASKCNDIWILTIVAILYKIDDALLFFFYSK